MPESDPRIRRIEELGNQAAARGRDVRPAGHFRALIDPSTDMVWLNYAVPVAPLGGPAEVRADLDRLRRIFSDCRRTLRFEFTESLWPELPGLLEEYGLQLQARHPFMLCEAPDFQPRRAAGVMVRPLAAAAPPEELAAYHRIQRAAFGFDPAEGAEGMETQFLEQLRTGGYRAALAFREGEPAGAGCLVTAEETAELAGVATHPAHRRRGVAATLSSALIGDHFTGGGRLVWLSAGDDAARAVYAGIGFRLAGARLNYIAESGGAA